MLEFLQRHAGLVTGVVSGFDRLLFRGTLHRMISAARLGEMLGMLKVRLVDAGDWMNQITEQVKAASLERAEAAGRPVIYLENSVTRKDELARQIAAEDRIKQGLICVLKVVEPCYSFQISRNRQRKSLELRRCLRKCTHLYHYQQHPELGLMHVRLQTWFPFGLQVWINGREWLGRQLDREKIGYLKRDNCFVQIADLQRAQALMDGQLRADWPALLDGVAGGAHPAHQRLWRKFPMDYYWSCAESEWATDVMFRDAASLAALYPALLRHGMRDLRSVDVLRYLGQKLPSTGHMPHQFQGELVSDLKHRPEGLRIKHRMKGNTIKMYDKHGSILRVETTLTDPGDFKVYRGTAEQPENLKWRPMRRGVADMHRRAQVSQAANQRYLQAMSAAQNPRALKELAEPLCRPTRWKGRRVRGLNPLEAQDAQLLEAVARPEFAINGFRNRDLRALLYSGKPADAKETRRHSSAITRKLRMLRAHGLIQKVARTQRYVVGDRGREILAAMLAARVAPIDKLLAA